MSDDFGYPLAAMDDYLIHQTPDPLRVMWSSDPRVYDRYWTVLHAGSGDLILALGGSVYPSLDTAEAYAIVNYKGDHRSVRAFRPIGRDRADLRVGPLAPRVEEGLKRWRYVLEDNEWEVSFDFVFEDTTEYRFRSYRNPGRGGFPFGRQGDVTSGFEGFGVAEGWVEVGGERIELDRETCHGTRDRHWGVGRDVGGPQLQIPGAPSTSGFSGNNFVAFADWAIWGNQVFHRRNGAWVSSDAASVTLRRLAFEADTRIFVRGIVDYDIASGGHKVVEYERVGFQTAYMRCGMYGGTPDTGRYPGMRVGELVEGDRYDVTNPDNRRHLSGLDEHLCRVTCDGETVLGVYQPIDPAAYEACAASTPGWRFLS